MRRHCRIAVGLVALSVCSLVGAHPLLADGLSSEPSRQAEQADRSSSASKIQNSLERLMSEAGPEPSLDLVLHPSVHRAFAMTDALTSEGFRVVIDVRNDDAVSEIRSQITDRGGQVEGVARSRIQARLASSTIAELAKERDVRFIRFPMSPVPRDPELTAQANDAEDEFRSEGLDAIGTAPWHEIGLNGQGVRVGVIDTGFKGYAERLGSELPAEPSVSTRSFRPNEDIACSNCPEVSQYHGLGTAEIVHDVAPRSELSLSNFQTDVQFERSVDWMIEQDVDVINTSLGFTSGCFRKGGGIFEPVIQKARDAGITWASSAGNEGNAHWQGTYNDPDDDGRHNFTAGDNTFTVDAELVEARANGQDVAAAILNFTLSWDAPCTGADRAYDVRIIPEDEAADPVRGSWTWRPGIPIRSAFNVFRFDADQVGETKTFQVVINKTDPEAPDVPLDMLIQSCEGCVDGDFDYLTPDGSVSILEPSISPTALTVGAQHHDPEACGELCPEGSLLSYSSRGPTKDGRTKPDVAAPTHVSTTAFGAWVATGDNQNVGFTGTSAASPHAAGAAALLQQAMPDGSPNEIMDALKRRAEDLGAPGADNLYGAGGLSMGPLPLDPSELNVTSISPGRAAVGQEIDATIHGTGLRSASEVAFEGDGVTASIRDGATANELPITISVARSAELGPRSFRVIGEGQEATSGRASLVVTGRPSFDVSEDRLTYEANVGDRGAPIRDISIANRGDGSLDWTARTTSSWLTVNPTSGSTPSEIRVLLTVRGLAPGRHEAQIVLEAEAATNSPFRIDVVLDVQGPEISVEPDRLRFETSLGESPQSQTLQIRNAGSGTLRWSVEPQAPWINVNVSSGSGTSELKVSIDAEELQPGTHRGAIRVEPDLSAVDAVTVPVIVRVQGPTELVVVQFERITFEPPEAWRRVVGEACVTYRNASDDVARVRLTPIDGDSRTYRVPSGNDAIVCGNVVHIDTRAEP